MLVPTIIMGLLAMVLVFIGYHIGEAQHIRGMKTALNMTKDILDSL